MAVEFESATAVPHMSGERYYSFTFQVDGVLEKMKLTVKVPDDGAGLESAQMTALGQIASFAERILIDLQQRSWR